MPPVTTPVARTPSTPASYPRPPATAAGSDRGPAQPPARPVAPPSGAESRRWVSAFCLAGATTGQPQTCPLSYLRLSDDNLSDLYDLLDKLIDANVYLSTAVIVLAREARVELPLFNIDLVNAQAREMREKRDATFAHLWQDDADEP
ncbi:MAG: hypothetical protein OXQ89_05660 [Rhodospirillaceae bacterium]|nr:hypothetical protein [Rhodospirillaceae bacterium]MDE0360382.1 hypothetical protein [Rhodospirillaceae bacterium]